MFDRVDGQRDGETPEEYRAALDRYREALRTVFHENIHLLARQGTSLAFPLDEYEGQAHRVLEEGVTERATRNELNNFIDALDIEQIVPGIKEAQAYDAYQAYMPAVDSFCATVGEDVGMDPDEVLHRMAVVNTAEKFSVAAELLYTEHLSQLVPGTAKADAVRRIAQAMHRPFALIQKYDPKDEEDVAMSGMAGVNAVERAGEEIQKIAERWSGNQDLRRALDAGLGATTAPGRTLHGGKTSTGMHTDSGEQTQAQSRNITPTDRRRSSGPAATSRE
ncbi:hypothetical protein [Kribbella sp. NPDC004536]|uniref:hypothetical protein n=1 Tax=Kribbella sp. NPDC004536 TaxID=3364106 RepID=UPI0036B29CF7